VIEAVMSELGSRPLATLADVLDADASARRQAALQVAQMTAKA